MELISSLEWEMIGDAMMLKILPWIVGFCVALFVGFIVWVKMLDAKPWLRSVVVWGVGSVTVFLIVFVSAVVGQDSMYVQIVKPSAVTCGWTCRDAQEMNLAGAWADSVDSFRRAWVEGANKDIVWPEGDYIRCWSYRSFSESVLEGVSRICWMNQETGEAFLEYVYTPVERCEIRCGYRAWWVPPRAIMEDSTWRNMKPEWLGEGGGR